MTTSFKRAAAAGFTLIELLIVVIILAIISAIAIPQFSAATSDAQSSALDANLATIRNSIEQYRAQHTGYVYPGATASEGATDDCEGEPGTGTATTPEQSLKDQLQYPSNAAGQTCTVANEKFRYGPYLRKGIPAEPFSSSDEIAVTADATITLDEGKEAVGWAYSTKTGQFLINNSGNDANGNPFSKR
ncbi:type II secretion system protein [Massilia sp. HP4]|uniref:type II secretion system protein n=1 Tax=Massilia sp. HP4 TaxID=2562316 RepID=UPI0010C1288B|nr:prepilin-type N-terminal cleavage/methylation domain-containing protein [Massilia sp. HP4]